MKFLDRVGLAIFSMLILIVSIVLILIGFNLVDVSIFSVLIGKVLVSQQATYIMIGVCGVLALLALKCLFFGQSLSRDSGDGVLLENSDGKLMITKSTIQSIVQGVIKERSEVLDSRTEVIFDKNSNISISIRLDVKKGTIIKDLSSKLQTKIKKNLKDSTNLDLDSVDIEVHSIEIEEQTEEQELKTVEKPKKTSTEKPTEKPTEKKTEKQTEEDNKK